MALRGSDASEGDAAKPRKLSKVRAAARQALTLIRVQADFAAQKSAGKPAVLRGLLITAHPSDVHLAQAGAVATDKSAKAAPAAGAAPAASGKDSKSELRKKAKDKVPALVDRLLVPGSDLTARGVCAQGDDITLGMVQADVAKQEADRKTTSADGKAADGKVAPAGKKGAEKKPAKKGKTVSRSVAFLV